MRCAGGTGGCRAVLPVALLALLLLFLASRLGKAWRVWRQPAAEWAELDRCPFCYGRDACAALRADVSVVVDGVSALAALLGDKNVVRARLRSSGRRLVLKRLGHDWELRRLDLRVCEPFPGDCDYDSVPNLHDVLLDRIKRLASADRLRLEPNEVGFAVCPDADLVSELLEAQTGGEERDGPLDEAAMLHSWTMMNVNAEPILLKYLSTDGLDWPVPELLGACGRIVVEAHAGEPLSSYASAPLSTRARIAVGLLDAADMFTFAHPLFRFYLTDVSADNVAVDEPGPRPIFVDLENVILLDKSSDRTDGERNHTSQRLDCPGCFAFSVDDICAHGLSDHNHYAVCLLIVDELFGGDAIRRASPKLLDSLSQCVAPPEGTSRFDASRLLREELESLASDRETEP